MANETQEELDISSRFLGECDSYLGEWGGSGQAYIRAGKIGVVDAIHVQVMQNHT